MVEEREDIFLIATGTSRGKSDVFASPCGRRQHDRNSDHKTMKAGSTGISCFEYAGRQAADRQRGVPAKSAESAESVEPRVGILNVLH